MLSVEIRVKGRIDKDWKDWFEGLSVAYTEENETILLGEVADQEALYGYIDKLRGL